MKHLPANTKVRWAVHPADQARLTQIDGMWDGETVPKEGALITRAFLVDPATKAPVPVRVVQVLEDYLQSSPPVLVVVVTRDQ